MPSMTIVLCTFAAIGLFAVVKTLMGLPAALREWQEAGEPGIGNNEHATEPLPSQKSGL